MQSAVKRAYERILCILIGIIVATSLFVVIVKTSNPIKKYNDNNIDASLLSSTSDSENDTEHIEISSKNNINIVNIVVMEHNFDNITYRINGTSAEINILCLDIRYNYKAKIIIMFEEGPNQIEDIYLFNTPYGRFYSLDSEADVLAKFKAHVESSNTKIDGDTVKTIELLENKIQSNQSKSGTDTWVSGTFRWRDSGNSLRPLRWMKVEAYDGNSIGGDTFLGEAYTDANGAYTIGFENNDSIFDHYGSDVYLIVRAITSAGIVGVNSSSIGYSWYSSTYEDVATGSTTPISQDFEMTEDRFKIFQILQAVMAGEYYAALMMNSTPATVTVCFPWPIANVNDNSHYNRSTRQIRIINPTPDSGCPYSYESWDMIMHEYGHHISYEVGIYDSPGGSHYIGEQLAISHTKEDAIKLAWAEAWATVFGLIAQKTYSSSYYIGSIPTVCDTMYTDYNILNNSIEEYQWDGEIREDAVAEILWDIYDSSNETNDRISLSYSDWWYVTTGSGAYSFSEFVQYFYFLYPDKKDDLGVLLEQHYIASTDISITTTALSCNPPTLTWNAYAGWGYYDSNQQIIYPTGSYFDKFTIEICGQGTNEIMIKNNLTTTSYTFTQSEWNTIISWTGISFEIRIGSYHSIVSPQTGIYYSEGVWFAKPTYLTSYIDNNTALEITGLKNTALENITIPTTIANLPVKSIGASAFSGNTNLKTMVIGEHILYIGENAFLGCNYLTIYSRGLDTNWHSNWNSSNRPYISNCILDTSDLSVNYFVKSQYNPENANAINGINNPTKSGYTFGAWYTTADFSGTGYSTIDSAPNSILYAKWNSNSSGSCITTGSLITLADGTQTAVENLTGNEQLLVWDMLNGTFTSAPILFIDSEITTTYDVITLTFSDGTQVEVIDEHAFFDTTLNKYVFLRSDAAQYIGHYFKKQSYDMNNNMTLVNVQLIDVSISQQVTTAYSPVTYGHLCYYVNGMLSMPGNTESFINIFDVDAQTMAYDQTSMAQDISTYGLYTYEEFSSIIPIPELVFNAFNGQYLKVAIGKGITTLQEIQNLLNRYMSFFE